MPTLVLDLLKYAFLAVLYIFIARAVKAVYVELRPPEARRRPKGAAGPAPARPPGRRSKKSARRITVIEGGLKGKSFEVGDELVIGRGEQCNVVLDDTYASQVHARISAKDDTVMVEDLGSTNGTYLNRQRLTAPAELQRGDQIKIGKTVLEMRK
jgi:pSer/pThr/pTyr-binding forkhead associated (FHA) protein